MIYLAILLILCGLLILITALSVETGRISIDGVITSGRLKKTGEDHSAGFEPEDVEIIFPGDNLEQKNEKAHDDEDIFISFDDEKDDFKKSGHLYENSDYGTAGDDYSNPIHQNADIPAERRRLDSTGRPSVIERRDGLSSLQRDDNTQVYAVMFDDRSNIIDYESGSGVIDSTFSKYKSIKRIGKGKIESDYDGVNFYLDEKLYRFDFHKVYDIWSGSNYIALPLKGNSTVKLFIIENSNSFPGKVEANFKEYEKGL